MIVADSPPRANAAGYVGIRTKSHICPYCTQHSTQLGMLEDQSWVPDDEAHNPASRGATTEAVNNTSAHTAVRPGTAVVEQLRYFSPAWNSPPDPMHAINLGLCKRFWRLFLIEACGNIGGGLVKALRVFNAAQLPSKHKRPDQRIGYPSGGNPTAEQWVTLFRALLPFALMELWSETLTGTGGQTLLFDPKKPSNTRLLRAPSWKGTLHSAAVKTTTPTRTLVGAPNLIHIEEGCHPVTQTRSDRAQTCQGYLCISAAALRHC
jgi:hypothetical protein